MAYAFGGALSVRELLGSASLYQSATRVLAKIHGKGKTQNRTDPPGFEMETVEEVVSYRVL